MSERNLFNHGDECRAGLPHEIVCLWCTLPGDREGPCSQEDILPAWLGTDPGQSDAFIPRLVGPVSK